MNHKGHHQASLATHPDNVRGLSHTRFLVRAEAGIDFEHFGLKLGMIIGRTFRKAYKRIFLPSNRGE